jgi:hypothetical protein
MRLQRPDVIPGDSGCLKRSNLHSCSLLKKAAVIPRTTFPSSSVTMSAVSVELQPEVAQSLIPSVSFLPLLPQSQFAREYKLVIVGDGGQCTSFPLGAMYFCGQSSDGSGRSGFFC